MNENRVTQTDRKGNLKVVDGGLSKKAHPAKFDSQIPGYPYLSDLLRLCAECKLPDNVFRFLCVIRNHTNKKSGFCYLRYETIAKEMGCSIRKAQDVKRETERLGLIQAWLQPTKKSKGKDVNHYRLPYSPGWDFDGIKVRMGKETSGGLIKPFNDDSRGANLRTLKTGESACVRQANPRKSGRQIRVKEGTSDCLLTHSYNPSQNPSLESIQRGEMNDGDFEDEFLEDDVLDILNHKTATPSLSSDVRNSNRESADVVGEPTAQDDMGTWDLNQEKTEIERGEIPPAPSVGALPRYEPVYDFRPKDIPGYPSPRDLLDDDCRTMRLGDIIEPFKDAGDFFEQFDDRFEPEDFDTLRSPAWEAQFRRYYDQVTERHWNKDAKPPGLGFWKLFHRAAVSGVLSSFGFKPEADDVFIEESTRWERMAQSAFEEPVISYLLPLGFISDQDTVESLAAILEKASKEPSIAKRKRDLECQIEDLKDSINRDDAYNFQNKKKISRFRELEDELEQLEDAKESADLKRARSLIKHLKKIKVDTAQDFINYVQDDKEKRKQRRRDFRSYPELREFIRLMARGRQWQNPEKERKTIWDINMDVINRILEEEKRGIQEDFDRFGGGYDVRRENWPEDFVRYLKDNERIKELKKYRKRHG